MKLRNEILMKGWLIAAPLLFALAALGQSVGYSNFYDIDMGLGVLESATLMDNGNLLVVGNNYNETNNWRDGFHVVVDIEGNVINQIAIASDLGEINAQTVLHSQYSEAYYSAGYFCDYSIERPTYCDYYFSKLGLDGDTLFLKVFQTPDTCDILYDVVETGLNRLLLIGQTCNDTVTQNKDLLLIAIDTLGNEVNRIVFLGGVRTMFILLV